jgi:alpha-L-arabinofuranosidase
LAQSVTGAASILLSPAARSQGAAAAIHVHLGESVGVVSPDIYGHFTEHIGGVIYDGVWVGVDSKIPNVDGIRKSVVDGLKQIKAPVIRWPGGCFADSYDWRDGIGTAAKRPKRTNFWETTSDAKRLHERGEQIFDDNRFGTAEFVRFCKLSGAEPYLAANLRSLSALDFDHWIEYCNSPADGSSYGKAREADGSREPFNVRYWGVGNESWGCGGNFRPEDYASEFRRFSTWVPAFGQDLYLVAAGPNDDDTDWTRRFFEQIYVGKHAFRDHHFRGWSIHHYSRVPKGDALKFGEAEWFQLLRSADETDAIIQHNWDVMGEYDSRHRVKIVVDEYGSWHQAGTEIDPAHIFGQQITIRDALVTALTLDCFNRHCDKVDMANCAQLVNNLNALFLAHEDRCWVTPNFHVFDLYSDHQGGQAVRCNFDAPNSEGRGSSSPDSFWGMKGSASLKGKTLVITAINPSVRDPLETAIKVNNAAISSANATILATDDIHAHNTFQQQNAVAPRPLSVQKDGDELRLQFPRASVLKLKIDLA